MYGGSPHNESQSELVMPNSFVPIAGCRALVRHHSSQPGRQARRGALPGGVIPGGVLRIPRVLRNPLTNAGAVGGTVSVGPDLSSAATRSVDRRHLVQAARVCARGKVAGGQGRVRHAVGRRDGSAIVEVQARRRRVVVVRGGAGTGRVSSTSKRRA